MQDWCKGSYEAAKLTWEGVGGRGGGGVATLKAGPVRVIVLVVPHDARSTAPSRALRRKQRTLCVVLC